MSAPPPSPRRLALAIGAAATSATIAIGVTATSLLGWFSAAPAAEIAPQTSAPAPTNAPAVILVPVAPTSMPPPATTPTGEVRLALEVAGRGEAFAHDDEHDDHEHRDGDHHEREEADDD